MSYYFFNIKTYLLLICIFFPAIALSQNHFEPIWTAPYLPMNIYVTGADLASGGSLGAGDEIGVFDGSNCVGSVLLTEPIPPSGYVEIKASADDPITQEIDGFISGNSITYKFWISAVSTEYDQYIEDYSQGSGVFVPQGTAVVSFTNIALSQNHFEPIWSAPYLPMNIYVTGADLLSEASLGAGDEIGVFDGSNCVGSVLLTEPIPSSGYVQIIASADDPITQEIDGFISGNSITYKFWISAISTEYDQYIEDYSQGSSVFVPLGTAVVSFTNVFPVELVSFNVNVKDNKVELNWQTATEVNNYGFYIERSVESASWETLGFVEGHGNSNSAKSYYFADNNPWGGIKFFYRLKQVDTDGKYEYSDEVEVELIPAQYEQYQNYPNPFNPITNIEFSLPEDAKVSIRIYNMLGELIDELVHKDYEAGYHKVEFNAANYVSGVYIYSLVTNNFTDVKKMMLIK